MGDRDFGDFGAFIIYLNCSSHGRYSFLDHPPLAASGQQCAVLASLVLYVEKMANLILASSSPRRQELLQQLGLAFYVHAPNIDESVLAHESVSNYVQRLAQQKAQAVLATFPDAVVIAADTSLSLSDQIIGKPENKQHAFEIWSMLSGRAHSVLTGVCVATQAQIQHTVVTTQVEFQQLSLADMEHYWASGEPMGKAGGYAIQGLAAQYIPRIDGSYSNVVGLPLYETVQLLKAVHVLD